jgi:hypothetical protein
MDHNNGASVMREVIDVLRARQVRPDDAYVAFLAMLTDFLERTAGTTRLSVTESAE